MTVALSRYQTIVSAKDAWEIDYDSVDPSMTKSTKSAIRLKDLLETITGYSSFPPLVKRRTDVPILDRYRPLTSFSQKLRFLIDIQIAILDQFHHRLHSAIEAYMVLTSSIARAVQGVSKEDQASLAGVGGLERLCRVYGSAEYLEKAMRDWSDDIVSFPDH
jgi:RAD50-interacting protein 1